jgi:hypothetical protein
MIIVMSGNEQESGIGALRVRYAQLAAKSGWFLGGWKSQ